MRWMDHGMNADGLSRPKLTRAFVGSGVAAAGLLTLAQQQLANFNLRHPVEVILVALLAFLGAFATGMGTAGAANDAAAEDERRLEVALAGRARQRVEDRSPFDLGVRLGPSGLGPYEPRPEDETLRQALARGGAEKDTAMILLVGPAGAGKSRAAYQAMAQTLPGAMLLDPVDGPAVDTLLAQRHRLGLRTDTRAVLWLDSLDRYFEGLDLDSLDELLFSPEPKPSMRTRVRRAGRRVRVVLDRARKRLERRIRPAAAKPFAVQRTVRRQVTLIATIRDDALRHALESDDTAGHVARRLTARMQIVPLPVWDSRFTSISTAALLRERGATVEPRSFEHRPAPRAGRGLLSLLAGIALVLAGLLAVVVLHEGWRVPPSLPHQAGDIVNALQTCQSSRESPPKDDLGEGSQWVLAVSSRDCPGTDMVRYFLVEHGRLTEQFSERPASAERWSFTCLATGKSLCLTPVAGGGPVMLGAFHSPDGHRLLPLALYRSDGATRLYAPFLPSSSSEGEDQASAGRPLTLQLQAGATYSPDPDIKDPLCRRPAQLCSYPAQFLAALPSSEYHPALLIAGYLQEGTIFDPRRIALRAYGLHYINRRVRLAPHSCLFYRAGGRVSKGEIHLTQGENVAKQMRQWWTPKLTREESVIC
jgi:hypothetical protein